MTVARKLDDQIRMAFVASSDSFITPVTKKKKKKHVTLIPQCGEGVTRA